MTLPEEVCADVAVCLSTHLKKLMSSNGSLVEMNEVIVEISCCFDSFPVGMHALSLCVMPAMLLMKTCLQCCIMELRLVLAFYLHQFFIHSFPHVLFLNHVCDLFTWLLT